MTVFNIFSISFPVWIRRLLVLEQGCLEERFLSDTYFCWQEKLLKTQCDLKAKMKEAMRLHDMEVKSVTEWQVTAEVVGHFLPLRPFQSEAAYRVLLGRACRMLSVVRYLVEIR